MHGEDFRLYSKGTGSDTVINGLVLFFAHGILTTEWIGPTVHLGRMKGSGGNPGMGL